MERVLATTGWSAAEWGRRASTSPSNITRFLKLDDPPIPRLDTLKKLAAAAPSDLPMPIIEVTIPQMSSKRQADDAVPFSPVPVPQPHEMIRGGLRVFGTAACHSTDFNGGFELNGEVVDRVAMPPALAQVPDAYGLYASGTSMEPRYHPGELVYVHPRRPARVGDYVVVQLRPDSDGGPPIAMIKRLISDSSNRLVLEQFNPAKRIEIPREQVLSVHRILTGDELF